MNYVIKFLQDNNRIGIIGDINLSSLHMGKLRHREGR